jgi:hypothetical protein
MKQFAGSLSVEEKETVRLCRQLRNKVLHTDFRAAREKLNELGVETPSGEVPSPRRLFRSTRRRQSGWKLEQPISADVCP